MTDESKNLAAIENGRLEIEGEKQDLGNITPFNKNRAKRTRAYRKLEKKYRRTRTIAGLMLLLLLTGAGLSIASLKRVSTENKMLTHDLELANFQIGKLHSDLQKVKADNDSLVQGRIPGLTPLKYDEPYKMENQVLKSIIFTRTSYNNKNLYEYLAVVHNNTNEVIKPSSLLILFNKFGVEVGRSYIAISQDYSGNNIELISLEPGESHSFTGTIRMISDDEPAYFKLIEQK